MTLKHDTAITHQRERVKRKERALAYLQLRSCSSMYSQMWFWANMGFLYTPELTEGVEEPHVHPKPHVRVHDAATSQLQVRKRTLLALDSL